MHAFTNKIEHFVNCFHRNGFGVSAVQFAFGKDERETTVGAFDDFHLVAMFEMSTDLLLR